MENNGVEFTVRRLGREVFWESESQLEHAALPRCALLAWDPGNPVHQVPGAVFVSLRSSEKPRGVVAVPFFSLLGKAGERVHSRKRRAKNNK